MQRSTHSFNQSKKNISILIVLFLTILCVGETVRAQVPNTLNYQGVITGADGKPVADGLHQLTFKLYTQAANGSAIWTETQSTTTTNGVFSVLLGKVTPLTNIPFDKPYWLGITVGSGSEMTPRVELSASAYSLRTKAVADSSVTGSGIASGQVIRSVNGMTDSVSIEAGSNVAIQQSAHKLTISSTGGGNSPWTTSNNDIAYTAGNVGIGAYSGGSAELLVSSPSSFTNPQLRLHETTSGYARLNFDNGSGSGNFWQIEGLTATTRTEEHLNFYNYKTGDIMSITGDGRVGIGAGTNPPMNTQLTVSSHHFAAGYFICDSTGGRGLASSSTAANGIGIYSTGGASGEGIWGKVTNPNGAIGVLGQVDGTGQGSGYGVEGDATATGTSENVGLLGGADNGSSNYGVFAIGGTTGSTNYAIYASGDVAYEGSLIHVSDAKFKENVQPLNQILSKVVKLAPKSYTFRNDPAYQTMKFSSGKQFGVIAQDVEKVFPNLVVDAVSPGINPNDPKAPAHPIHYKGVKYLQMIPILLEAIKEQQQEIQQLQAQVAQLKK